MADNDVRDSTSGGIPEGASSMLGLFEEPNNDNHAPIHSEGSSESIEAMFRASHNVNGIRNKETSEKIINGSEHAAADPMPQTLVNNEIIQSPEHSGKRDMFCRSNTARLSNKHTKTLMETFDDPDEQPVQAKERTAAHPPPHERLPLLHNRFGSLEETALGDLYSPTVRERKGSFVDIFSSHTESTPKAARKLYAGHTRSVTDLPAIDETHSIQVHQDLLLKKRWRWNEFRTKHLQPSTFVGAGMFLLYHVVFCLAMGSSIIRKHSDTPILGLMAKTAACGVIFSVPVFIYRLGSYIPALYPSVDLFLAPFIANIASIVDETLQADNNVHEKDEDQVFIATLVLLSGIGFMSSGLMLLAASKFKLANLGSYLPFPVLCGFFSFAGIKLWALAFAVDTNGKTASQVFGSGNTALISNSLLHHLPSFIIAVVMRWLGPKNPFYVSMLVVSTIALFYSVMAISGTSLEEAREKGWFWSERDLVYESRVSHFGFDRWAPPAPFGVLNAIAEGKIHWGAVSSSMSAVFALSFLYFLRCSIHGTALKKHVSNLARPAKEGEILPSPTVGRSPLLRNRHNRQFSEALDIEAVVISVNEKQEKPIYRPGSCHLSLEKIMSEYGHNQIMCALVGSFGIVPSVAVAPTMFSLGAEGVAPQYGSVILLAVFYLTDFQLVGYIPKAAFSCLIVLAFLDMMITWLLKSYQKTSEKMEWLVVPVIIISAFVVGLLNAVFLGVAASTFLFVASFFRSGVVKFAASGLTVRSTIERDIKSGSWLDVNGDLIQILVLQNYLFFGNASSILTYITSMFERNVNSNEGVHLDFPPIPKFVILDFTLVTGMDTSTVDVVEGIISVCHGHSCKVFLTGLLPRIRKILSLGGVKPETRERSKRKLRFFPDLDAAIGKAEDMLLESETDHSKPEVSGGNRRRLYSEGDNGFSFALRHIDEQHGKHFAEGLVGLQKYTSPIELAPGECLFSCDGGPVKDHQRGLFFIEEGVIKIERDSSVTLTRGSSRRMSSLALNGGGSLRRMEGSGGSIGRRSLGERGEKTSHHFRIARIGPGWVVGTIEGASGVQNPGYHVAVSHCRLHQLPFSKMQEIEEEDPKLMMRLYKLLAHTMVRRQEVTIEQLATLNSILTSPAQNIPIGSAVEKTL